MEVMDLSIRKPHPLQYPDPYLIPTLPLYNYQPPTLHPLPPTHLGLFQHLKYSPHSPPPMEPTRPPSSGSEGSAKSQPIQRPFKTLSKNNLTLVSALDPSFEAEYEQYRQKVLSRVSHDDYPATNRNMRRNVSVNPEKSKDPEYLERRRKNNEAAKKSREARRAKEDELAIRVAFLEKENLKMKFQLAAIEREKKMLLMRRGHL